LVPALYVLSYGDDVFRQTERSGRRFDQPFVEFLNTKKLPYVDLMQAHLQDFAQRKTDMDNYIKQSWIGHYSPPGNFFEAMATRINLLRCSIPSSSATIRQAKSLLKVPGKADWNKVGH
jgi:hypothetical protein